MRVEMLERTSEEEPSALVSPEVILDCGHDDVRLGHATLVGLPWEERHCSYRCGSGRRWTDVWRGPSVGALLDRFLTETAADATHLLVQSTSGHVSCISMLASLDGILALERGDGTSLIADVAAPRFIAPGIDAPRTVKAVQRLTPCRLAPGERPEDYEQVAGDPE